MDPNNPQTPLLSQYQNDNSGPTQFMPPPANLQSPAPQNFSPQMMPPQMPQNSNPQMLMPPQPVYPSHPSQLPPVGPPSVTRTQNPPPTMTHIIPPTLSKVNPGTAKPVAKFVAPANLDISKIHLSSVSTKEINVGGQNGEAPQKITDFTLEILYNYGTEEMKVLQSFNFAMPPDIDTEFSIKNLISAAGKPYTKMTAVPKCPIEREDTKVYIEKVYDIYHRIAELLFEKRIQIAPLSNMKSPEEILKLFSHIFYYKGKDKEDPKIIDRILPASDISEYVSVNYTSAIKMSTKDKATGQMKTELFSGPKGIARFGSMCVTGDVCVTYKAVTIRGGKNKNAKMERIFNSIIAKSVKKNVGNNPMLSANEEDVETTVSDETLEELAKMTIIDQAAPNDGADHNAGAPQTPNPSLMANYPSIPPHLAPPTNTNVPSMTNPQMTQQQMTTAMMGTPMGYNQGMVNGQMAYPQQMIQGQMPYQHQMMQGQIGQTQIGHMPGTTQQQQIQSPYPTFNKQ